MLEILVSIATVALFFYAIKLAFKLTWGVAKIIAVILFTSVCTSLAMRLACILISIYR